MISICRLFVVHQAVSCSHCFREVEPSTILCGVHVKAHRSVRVILDSLHTV